MSTHHLQLFAEDGEIRPRLTCTATPDSVCRRRPVDTDQESWTDEDETTPGHECWAVEWAEDGGWDTVTAADGILSSVDVEVTYDEGVVVDLATPHQTLPDLAEPSDAEVQAAAWAIHVLEVAVEGFVQDWEDLDEASRQYYIGAARIVLLAARKVARHDPLPARP